MSHAILPDHEIRDLVRSDILSTTGLIADAQIQPASLDLSLGTKITRLRASFLPRNATVMEKAAAFTTHTMSIPDNGLVLDQGAVYLAELQERLDLPAALRAIANPKSSTGRLDVFVRLLTDGGEDFDVVPPGYSGPLYLEIAPRTFPILVHRGTRLTQLRFVDLSGRRVPETPPDTLCRINLNGVGTNGIVGYRAKRHSAVIDLARIGQYDPLDFWEPIPYRGTDFVILDPNEFYIFTSSNLISIPVGYAADMVPFEASTGEFRVHYAGFFDPGFGGAEGCRAVLEVRSHDVPFALEHDQKVARLRFESLTSLPEVGYGKYLGSNYQGQSLKLAKQFAAA